MGKSINWDLMRKSAVPRLAGGTQYRSIKDAIAENTKQIQAVEKLQKSINDMMPALNQLLLIRLKNHTPLKVMKSFQYLGSEMRKAIVQKDDDPRMANFYANESRGDDNPNPLNFGSDGKCHLFQDTPIMIPAGEELVLKSLIPTMEQFIFQDSKGQEHEISYSQKDVLLMNTDIFDVVSKIYNGNKE